MRITKATIMVATIVLAACGTQQSSEETKDKEDRNQSTGTPSSAGNGGASQTSFVPALNFTIPGSSSFALQEALELESKTILERKAERMERVIEKINNVVGRLNNDRIIANGGFEGKGPDGLLSGKIATLDNDEDYATEAVLCHDGNVFMHMKWSTDHSKISVVRDFSTNPMGAKDPTELISEVTYEASETTSLNMRSFGTPWKYPDLELDGDLIVSSSHSTIDSQGVFEITGVADRFADVPESFEGDEYLIGRLAADGSGSFVGYRKANTDRCVTAMDEADPAAALCLGREVGSDQPYTDEERVAAWAELESIGMTSKEDLQKVSLSDELTCE